MPERDDGGVGIRGMGRCVPRKKVTSGELAKQLHVTHDWILERSGIEARYFADKDETAAVLSEKASKQALERAGVKAEDVQMIMASTFSGEHVFPGLACKIQQLLGAKEAGAFDLSAGAAGFPIALSLASERMRNEPAMKHGVIVGAAIQSPYLDFKNPGISILFGDGAGAAVLSRVPEGYGVLASEIFCRSEAYEAVRLAKGPSSYIEMDGEKVGKEYLKSQAPVIERALKKAGLTLADVDLFVFHQANLRLIQFLMKRLKLPMSKTYTNVEQFGNTSDASCMMALCEASEKGLLKRGQTVVISGVGAGVIFAVTVLRWY